MKERFSRMSGFQKFILIALVVMAAGFGLLYIHTIRREGYQYYDGLLIPSQENGNTVWSGVAEGRKVSFTVHPDKSVEYRWGDSIYGPYTVKEDPSAVRTLNKSLTGIEIRRGETVIFRGGMEKLSYGEGDYYHLIWENGTPYSGITISTGTGVVMDEKGQILDVHEPDVYTIVSMMYGPVLTHRGHAGFWFLGLLCSFILALSVLYADDIFRWNIRWTVRGAEDAQPTDYAVTIRGLSWIVVLIVVLALYVTGLRLW